MKCNTCGTENIEGAHFCASCGATLSPAGEAPSGLIGQMVGGRYLVKRVLGEGGMGVVYEAEQRLGSNTRKVALKTLHPHLSHDPSVAARFNRECGTIAGLEHPNTIKVYDFGATDDGTLYIAMEFVAGQSLQQIIEKGGALPPDRVLKIVRQIAGSLEEAHSQGIIHRDLKPDNVVLTHRAGETDVVKLLDFGIAARTDSVDAQREQKLTQQGMVLGTPPYMSPEQFTGKALDLRSDIYSLGVMSYEMVTGVLPFDAATPWQWATEHMTSQPKPFEASPVAANIPPAMRQAILRALSKNREDRQSGVREFYEELAGERKGVAVAGGSTGTAVMQAPPQFGGGSAKTAAMPSGGGVGTGAAVAAPVTPMIAPPRSGGKGLIYALAGVGSLLLIGIVIVATKSGGGSTTPIAATAEPTAATPTATPTKIDPQVDPTQAAQPIPPTATPPPVQTTPPPTTKTPVTKPTPAQPTTPPATTTPPVETPPLNPQPVKPPPVVPVVPKGDRCDACISAASSGNIQGAAAAYAQCQDPGKKGQCASVVRGRAGPAAKEAAFNGNCAQAKAIIAAGQAMGVSSATFAQAKKACP